MAKVLVRHRISKFYFRFMWWQPRRKCTGGKCYTSAGTCRPQSFSIE